MQLASITCNGTTDLWTIQWAKLVWNQFGSYFHSQRAGGQFLIPNQIYAGTQNIDWLKGGVLEDEASLENYYSSHLPIQYVEGSR